jgi:hypothetical protein
VLLGAATVVRLEGALAHDLLHTAARGEPSRMGLVEPGGRDQGAAVNLSTVRDGGDQVKPRSPEPVSVGVASGFSTLGTTSVRWERPRSFTVGSSIGLRPATTGEYPRPGARGDRGQDCGQPCGEPAAQQRRRSSPEPRTTRRNLCAAARSRVFRGAPCDPDDRTRPLETSAT